MNFVGHQPQQTVHVRVQVIDMKSFVLDLQVPTYLPARDLTQRVARDAGLDAFWPDGKRRLYWLRARGRLLQDNETLADLGVIDRELVYLLPEPPAGSGVLEQVPEYPENRGYAGKGTLALIGAIGLLVVWAAGWGAALVVERSLSTVMLPGLGMGFLCIAVARHMWGGQGSRPRVPVVAIALFLMFFVLVFLPPVLMGERAAIVYTDSVAGLITGLIGIFVGWLAWWGGVEPLPPAQPKAVVEQARAVVMVPCAICGLDVSPEVRADCGYGCGKAFHKGCYQARLAVYRGDKRFCAVCNTRVG